MNAPLSVKQILDMDAHDVLAAYRAGTLTPSRAVEAYIEHQKRFNPAINAVCEDRYAAARAEAATADERLARGEISGRLFGVPMSMKEAFDVAGMHTTGALRNWRENVVNVDADAVKRLKAEGAIIMDKTNTPSLCYCQETDNYLFGRSNNPWDVSRTTGGSSGGEAALMAVGGAAAGFGSDIGGSIRIPSHFNGVVGFKPGAGRFIIQGHFPYFSTPNQEKMLGYGPIVKSVRDAALIYGITFPEFKAPAQWRLPTDLRVVSFGSFDKVHATPETDRTVFDAQSALRDAGVAVDTRPPAFMSGVTKAWQLTMSEDHAETSLKMAYPDNPNGFVGDYLKAKLGMSATHHPFLSWALIGTRLFPPSRRQAKWVAEFVKTSLGQLDELLGPNGVMVIPTYPTPAKPHGKVYAELFSLTLTFHRILPFTVVTNALGLPAMVMPCGRSPEGLPIGLQIVGYPGREEAVFQVGKFLEDRFGGYRRNTDFD